MCRKSSPPYSNDLHRIDSENRNTTESTLYRFTSVFEWINLRDVTSRQDIWLFSLTTKRFRWNEEKVASELSSTLRSSPFVYQRNSSHTKNVVKSTTKMFCYKEIFVPDSSGNSNMHNFLMSSQTISFNPENPSKIFLTRQEATSMFVYSTTTCLRTVRSVKWERYK